MRAWLVPVILLLCFSAADAPKPPTKDKYQSFAMTHQGDVERGRKLFLDEQRLACAKCHTTDGTSGRAGPDLLAIGDKFGRRELIEAVLSPSATIAVGYSTTVVKTRSGDSYDGILKEASDAGLKLIGGDGKIVSIAATDIAQRRTTDLSLMPEDLYTGLSVQEFADLVEYLARLRLPESAAAVRHGAPLPQPEAPHGNFLERTIQAIKQNLTDQTVDAGKAAYVDSLRTALIVACSRRFVTSER